MRTVLMQKSGYVYLHLRTQKIFVFRLATFLLKSVTLPSNTLFATNMSVYHTPVLLEESVNLLDVQPDGTYARVESEGGEKIDSQDYFLKHV